MKISKIYWRIASLLFAFLFLTFLFPGSQHAYADGGAPNLAYVAGSAKGISVIDIGQQKVTGSFLLTYIDDTDSFCRACYVGQVRRSTICIGMLRARKKEREK